jgi:hypothetical protein
MNINLDAKTEEQDSLSKKEAIELTIESWEWKAKTGLRLMEWEKYPQLLHVNMCCGFSHQGYIEFGKNHIMPVGHCESCKFADVKLKHPIGKGCMDGLAYQYREETDIEKKKAIAEKVLKKIRKVYPKNKAEIF